MRILMIGYGQMGKLVERIAGARNHDVRAVDPSAPSSPNAPRAKYQQLTDEALEWADTCIDFSRPEAVLDTIEVVTKAGRDLVMGSTGWYEEAERVQALVEERSTGFLYASNFSLGVNLFMKMVRQAGEIMNRFDQYDVAGLEIHHKKKVDSPSGTAHTLSEILLETMDRKTTPAFDALQRQPHPEELHFASVRSGYHPGTHEVIFDSAADSISLRHTARTREGFAEGAVYAAEWLHGRKGFYTIDDFVNHVIGDVGSNDQG